MSKRERSVIPRGSGRGGSPIRHNKSSVSVEASDNPNESVGEDPGKEDAGPESED